MRPFILLVAVQLIFTAVQSQVTGLVKDDQGSPVKGATISLLRATDSGVVKFAASGADGTYSFSGIKEGSFRVKASFVGYKPFLSPVFAYTGTSVAAPQVVMQKASAEMKAVVVTATKPLIEVRA